MDAMDDKMTIRGAFFTAGQPDFGYGLESLAEDGIALFDDMGVPIEGRVTRQIDLWDAGTEVNQAPGIGVDQAPRQAGPDIGADEMGIVQLIAGCGRRPRQPQRA